MANMNFSARPAPCFEDTSEDHSEDEESPDDSSTFKDSETSEHDHGKSIKKEEVSIAGQESVGVQRWRRMVIVMLLLTAALVITSTYLFLSREETDEFEKSVSLSMLRIQQAMFRGDTTQPRSASDHSHNMEY
jgi:hypothetical protein